MEVKKWGKDDKSQIRYSQERWLGSVLKRSMHCNWMSNNDLRHQNVKLQDWNEPIVACNNPMTAPSSVNDCPIL